MTGLTGRRTISAPTEVPSLGQHAGPAVGSVAAQYLDQNRMKARSTVLVDFVTKVDTHSSSEASLAEALTWIREQYPKQHVGVLLGLFARCYLGPPYIDHTLDLFGNICKHHKPEDSVVFPYHQARSLVRSDAYAYVEIYSDGTIVPVRTDGTPVKTTIGRSE